MGTLARSVLVEYEIAQDAAPGTYRGTITIAAPDLQVDVPVELQVLAVPLPPIPMPVGLLMNALPVGPDDMGDEQTWWRLQESLLQEQVRY